MAAAKKTSTKRQTPQISAATRILVLYGKEQMRKRLYLSQLREALEQQHGEVEVFSFDGKSATLSDVLDELRAFSLMQTHKIVLIEDAEAFVKSHRQALERYAKQPVDHATLVLRAETWNKGNLDKHIASVGAVVECREAKPQEAVDWVIARAKSQHGRLLEKPAAQAMVDRLGVDLSRLDSELSKVAVLGETSEPIKQSHVEELVGKDSDEQAWAAQEALLQALETGSTAQAVRTIRELIELSNQPEPLVMYSVADLWRKLAVASMLRRQGWRDRDIFKHLRIWGPREKMCQNILATFDERTLARMFDRALQLDARAKSGLGEPVRNLERFCVSLRDVAR